ncbi:MAG: TrkH family potassium uptake protein [Desulfobacteraceae bacterium]|nr:TrkH family potassium uptake protein [Desulfobacteraceae bacterium]
MRWGFVLQYVGILVFFLGLTMLLPLGVDLFYRDGSAIALAESAAIAVLCGGVLFSAFRREKTEHISQREAMTIVAFGWAAIGFFGAFPFYISGMVPTFADAFFESVSGFTTTGASVLTEVESVAGGLLFWRSFIQWLGGMGIIVLTVAILPFLGVGGFQLYKAEVPSPVPDKLRPRIRDTAKALWKVYLLFSLAEVLLLLLGGMTLYDALCHTFTTMPTGGYSTKNLSIAYFDSLYFDVVIMGFMVLAGINFSLHFRMLQAKPLAYWRNPECRYFIFILLILICVVSINLFGPVYDTLGESLRYGAFQVISILTTTGYATADYNQWPALARLILLMSMFAGASAGSTGGGMKIMRIMVCFKFCYKELFNLLHPHSVSYVKIAGRPVPDTVINGVLGFLALYIGIFALCSLLLAAMGVDFVTSFSAAAASIGNIGPGLALVGPTGNYADIPYFGKWLLSLVMLLGRLEIYTIIIFLAPEFWRK